MTTRLPGVSILQITEGASVRPPNLDLPVLIIGEKKFEYKEKRIPFISATQGVVPAGIPAGAVPFFVTNCFVSASLPDFETVPAIGETVVEINSPTAGLITGMYISVDGMAPIKIEEIIGVANGKTSIRLATGFNASKVGPVLKMTFHKAHIIFGQVDGTIATFDFSGFRRNSDSTVFVSGAFPDNTVTGIIRLDSPSEIESELGEFHGTNWLAYAARAAFAGSGGRGPVFAYATSGDIVEDFGELLVHEEAYHIISSKEFAKLSSHVTTASSDEYSNFRHGYLTSPLVPEITIVPETKKI